MDFQLTRTAFRADGIFSELRNDAAEELFVTCEHSYPDGYGNFLPKLPDGIYVCVRGMHQLEHMKEPFETFEITGVPGHTGILLHVGNFNIDSDGCVLVGFALVQINGQQAISQSQYAFNTFMSLEAGCDQFKLTVKSN